MIDDLWFKVFILIYWCIIGLAIGVDVKYYAKHFKGGKNARKDNPR